MKKLLSLIAVAFIAIAASAQTVLWQSEDEAGVLVGWGNPCFKMSADEVNAQVGMGDSFIVTVSGEGESGWPQIAFFPEAGGWPPLGNAGIGGKTFPYVVEFPITATEWKTISTEGVSFAGDGAYISKVELKKGEVEIGVNTVWFGNKQCNWGDPVSVPASVFANVKAGDVLKVWTSEASCQIILGGWSGLNLGVYAAGDIDNMTYEDGVATVTMVDGYAETNTYGDNDLNIFELMKANGVVIQGPTTITRIDYIPALTLGELAEKEPSYDEPESVIVALNGAKVTASYEMDEDMYQVFVEDETGAVAMIDMTNEIADLAQGKALTGTIKGAKMDYGFGAMFAIEEFNCTAEDVDVTTGAVVYSAEDLDVESSYVNRLVTIYNSENTPIVNEEGQLLVCEKAIVADIYHILGDYTFPKNVVSVTGVLNTGWGIPMIMPRSAEDIVAVAEEPAFTLGELWTIGSDEAVEVNIKVDGAKVTFYNGGIGFMEDETGAVQLYNEEEVEGLATGVTVTGTFKAEVIPAAGVVAVLSTEGLEFGEADVTTGKVVTDEELEANIYRLVTVENPTTVVLDAFELEIEIPEAIKTVTGIVYAEDGELFIIPRSAEDIVAAEAEPLYTAAGATLVDEEWESAYRTAYNVEGNLTVDAYEDYVIIRGFDGVEGYDLKVGFDEEENVTAVSVLHNGEETDATAGWANSGNAYWYVYTDEGSAYAGSDPETESGYVLLSAYVGNDYVYYYVAWGEEEDDPTTGINNTTANKVAQGEIFNLAGQKVDAQYKGIVIKNGKKVLVK